MQCIERPAQHRVVHEANKILLLSFLDSYAKYKSTLFAVFRVSNVFTSIESGLKSSKML